MRTLPLPVKRLDNRVLPRLGSEDRQPIKVVNISADSTEVYLYNEIGAWGITAEDFVNTINEIKTPKMSIRINSPGGSVFDGAAIYNALQRHPAEKTATVDGIAASAASWIALAADKVVMGQGTYMMVHNAMGMTFGNSADHRQTADLLDKLTNGIADIYAAKSGTPVDQWKTLMDAETWLSASEAVAAGLANSVIESPAVTNQFDQSRFANVPGELKAKAIQNARDLETALRDAGLSRNAAKAAISQLRDESQRDAGDEFANGVKELMQGMKSINEVRKEMNNV